MFNKGKNIYYYANFFIDFAKEIFEGSKKLMKLSDIKFITVVKYDELSVKGLYSKFLALEGISQYFPTKYAKGRQCDRDYMWNIANSLHPVIVASILENAIK